MEYARSNPVLGGPLAALYNLGAAGPMTDGQLLDRFLARNDPAASEAAFTALIERHGAMVLGICRQFLGDSHDAHDAFQVLVSKAGSIRSREAIGGWLFGIARRVAARAQVESARRRRHLRELFENQPVSSDDGAGVTDYGPLIDAIDRLPEQLRSPVVLHYFEGLSTEATAQRLGCPRGTVLSRLSRARSRIKERLEQRGVSFSVLIPASDALNRWLPIATVPADLAQTTVRAASSLGLAGAAIESIVPATVATLSRGVVRTLVLSKVRVGACLFLLAIAGVSIGLAATLSPDEPRRTTSGPEMVSPPRGMVTKSEKPLVDERARGNPVTFRGKVTDPDGKPVAGAEILLGLRATTRDDPEGIRHVAASGPAGRFEVAIPRKNLDRSERFFEDPPVLSALVPGFGPDWVYLTSKNAGDELNIRLRRDDVPIEGRIIDLEGRPVPSVSVHVFHLWGDPPDFPKRVRENGGEVSQSLLSEGQNGLILGEQDPRFHALTDPDGRFRLTGVGRDRRVTLIIHGESIERSYAMIFTTSDPAYTPLVLPVDESDFSRHKLQGPRFDLTVAPGRVIEGVIRDAETGRPVPGARVRSWKAGSSLSDARGRFRLTGHPMNAKYRIEVDVEGQTYIKVVKMIGNPTGLGPIVVDINLRRGLILEGKVTNRSTSRPARAIVQYYPFRDNPHLKEYPDASFFDNGLQDEAEFRTDVDGHFRAVVLPGGGILAVRTPDPTYLTAKPLALKVAGNVLWISNFANYMGSYQALVPIDLRDGGKSVLADIGLVPGRPQRVQVVGPDGRPIADTRALSHQIQTGDGEAVPGTDFTFFHRDPGKSETLLIFQQDQGLGAFVHLKGDEPDPIRVSLRPLGTVIGRLVDEEGKPRPKIRFSVGYECKTKGDTSYLGDPTDWLETDRDGRFRIRNLILGLPCGVSVYKKNPTSPEDEFEGYLDEGKWPIKPGEILDWGDIQVKND